MGVTDDEIGQILLKNLEAWNEGEYLSSETQAFLLKWNSEKLVPFFQRYIIQEIKEGHKRTDIIEFFKLHNSWEKLRVEYDNNVAEFQSRKEVLDLIQRKYVEQDRNAPRSATYYGSYTKPEIGGVILDDALILKAKKYLEDFGDFRVIYHPDEYNDSELMDVSSSHNNWQTNFVYVPVLSQKSFIEILPPSDNAQLSEEVGGIDLNPNNFEIETRGENPPVQFEFDAQKLQDLNIQGFVPVIINITPITNIPLLLGIADEGPSGQKQATTTDESAPLDRRERFSLRETGELSRL